jgi:hypothetical protein
MLTLRTINNKLDELEQEHDELNDELEEHR